MSRKSLEQSMCDALALYLTAQFAAPAVVSDLTTPGVADSGIVQVLPEWAAPDSPLPPKCITVFAAGERQDDRLQEAIIRQVPGSAQNTIDATWAVKVCHQPVQLDVWAHTAPERDAIKSWLDDFLHQGTAVTLGLARGDTVRDGVLLRLPTGPDYPYAGFVDFVFDGASNMQDMIREREARAMIRGAAEAVLTVRATHPKLVRVFLEAELNGSSYESTLEPAGNPPRFVITESVV